MTICKTDFRLMNLTNEQTELLIDAIWKRQHHFIAGDRRYREYGELLETLEASLPYKYTRDEFR